MPAHFAALLASVLPVLGLGCQDKSKPRERPEPARRATRAVADVEASLNDALVRAVLKRSPSEVEDLLAKRADPNAMHQGFPLLCIASQESPAESSKIVDVLLDFGARPESSGPDGMTALGGSCYVGATQSVKTLLSFGANPNAQSTEGMTPLIGASFRGDSTTVQALIDAGADPNMEIGASASQKELLGYRALHFAARSPVPDTVVRLIQSGAAVDVVSVAGITPVMEAAEWSSQEVVAALIGSGAETDRVRKDGSGILDFAVRGGSKPVVEVTMKSACFGSAAAKLGALVVVEDEPGLIRALESGGDANCRVLGDPLLLIAVRTGHSGIVQALVAKGADARAPIKMGQVVTSPSSQALRYTMLALPAARTPVNGRSAFDDLRLGHRPRRSSEEYNVIHKFLEGTK